MMSLFDMPYNVKAVRVIRQKYYEETKNRTCEARWECYRKKHEVYEEFRKTVNPADYDFSRLKRKV